MSGRRVSVNLCPTAIEAIEALDHYGDGATWSDIAIRMPGRTKAAITRGINTACRAGHMHWRPLGRLRPGQERRLYRGGRP